jgi:Flp pilus assembly protein TadD
MRGDLVAGIAHLRRALDLDPDNAYAANLLGVAMLQRGDVAGALAQWNEILEAHPDDGNAMSNLAWIYATSPRSEQRDGRRAVDLATRAAAIAHDKNALVLRTLAAAYAETGRFDEAVASATIALQLAKAQKNSGLIAELQPSIALYESHRPLRDPSLAREAD